MAMRFQILGSSSSGNASLVQTDDALVLIDAGFSGRRLCGMLEEAGFRPEDVNAVLLTHEHGDHACGVRGLMRFRHLTFFANYATANAVQRDLSRRAPWELFETGSTFQFRDLEISSFPVPHDAYDPVGFILRTGEDDLFSPRRELVWMTDLGHVPPQLAHRVGGADCLVLESNHDTELLDADPHRPFSVKQRIRGRHGHLSNDAAEAFLRSVDRPRWQRVFLAHLSKDCNREALVRDRYEAADQEPLPFSLDVIDPTNGGGPMVEVGGLNGSRQLREAG